MFNSIISIYALKKAVKHELAKVGVERIGWDYESEKSHHEEKGSPEAAIIFAEAIKRSEEIKKQNG